MIEGECFFMLNPAWIFVLATVIAVFGILSAFKSMMATVKAKIEEGHEFSVESLQKVQTRFFIKVALAESIPILLIVFGFMQIEQTNGQGFSVLLPLTIIGAVFIIALVNIVNIRSDSVGYNEHSKTSRNMMNTLTFIGIALVAAIPIVSTVAIYVM